MTETLATNSRIVAAFAERTKQSRALAMTAREVLPSGVVHDSRILDPWGIYVERAAGAHKWDVDGNRYVDFFGGHGALLLGHNHPKVLAAMQATLAQGTHFAASHVHELRWAQKVQELVPSVERIRFTSSGTEASMMAFRLARAFTGRPRLLRFRGHFHGWEDDVAAGYSSHFDGSATSGVPANVAANSLLIEPGDPDAVETALAANPDIAAVILEPLGHSTGMKPLRHDFLRALREITQRRGVLLIFDEVVTGFRVAPGGMQQLAGVRPDLTCFAKILAGGLPGGAVGGRKEIFEWLDLAASRADGRERIYHPGTFNANPLSAAAGFAALDIIGSSDACALATSRAQRLREGWTKQTRDQGVGWAVYGEHSATHIFMNAKRRSLADFDPYAMSREELATKPAGPLNKLRVAMLVNGVDLSGWPGGVTSTAHSEADIDHAIAAFGESLRMLRAEGEL